MDSLRKWFYKPKRDDRSLLAQFFFADETLNMVAAELDSFDGRENPERCSTLVNQLRHAQERVLNITGQIMDQFLGNERVPRGFRVKFPEDVLQDNLAGQLWFGAECLAAGSSIMNREEESLAMRPLALALTRSLETVRSLLRDHCLRYNRYGALPPPANTEMLHESLKIFDRLFAEFELCYVSAMVHVKTPREYEVQQHICVLFSETLQRARRIGLLTQEQVDDYDPALMFAIPRLAIVSGLLIFSNGPLSIDKSPDLMSDMFRPFRTLLHKIRELLWTLDRRELYLLEKLLCTNEDIANIRTNVDISNDGPISCNVDGGCYPDISEFVTRFYSDHSHCKDMINQIGCEWGSSQLESTHSSTLQSRGERHTTITDADYLPENVEILSPLLDGMRRLSDISDNSNETLHQSFFASALDAKLDSSLDEPISGDKSKMETCSVIDGVEQTFHTRDDNLVTFNVEYVETNTNSNIDTKDSDNDKSQDNSVLSLTKSERRNSNKSVGSSRKSSRNESISSSQMGDFMTRNLSSGGLSMFDPLAGASTSTINVNPMPSDNNVLLPDQVLVSNLSDQVTEIADKLSSISFGEIPENNVESSKNLTLMDPSISNLLHDQVQIFSFSTNDVSNLVSEGTDPEFNNVTNVTYSPSRNDKVMSQTNMPSTSHGYLILNAISQEPAIMASLSNNSSIIYNEDSSSMINQPSNNVRNTEGEIYVANANLSCLLLTNEEYQSTFLSQENSQHITITPTPQDLTFTNTHFDDSSFFSTNDLSATSNETMISQNDNPEKPRFMMEYGAYSNDQTPADSGICTENTSLDRSPDSETKDIDDKNNNSHQILVTNDVNIKNDRNNSISKDDQTAVSSDAIEDLVFNDNSNVSNSDSSGLEIIREDTENTANKSDISDKNDSAVSEVPLYNTHPSRDIIIQDIRAYLSASVVELEIPPDSYDNVNVANNECTNILTSSNENREELPKQASEEDTHISRLQQSSNNVSPAIVTDHIQQAADETHFGVPSQVPDQSSSTSNPTGVLNQRKLRKASPKNKKKSVRSKLTSGEGRHWSPGRVILQNRSHVEQKTPMKLNLEQFVDDCGGGSCSSQSSATSSFHSDWADDEEIALALQAQEFASRHQTRSKFRSSEDMIHRLFVCIAGVADQLQTNFAPDLRNILKSVFLMNQTPEIEPEKPTETETDVANTDDVAQQDAEAEVPSNRNNASIEYEASDSDIITNRGSFDSIHSAEEVYADVQGDENEQNAVNERRNSQTVKQSSSQRQSPIETQSTHRINIKPTLDSSSLQNSASIDSNRRHDNYEDDKIADYTQRRSSRNSNSSLESNNSENINPSLTDNVANELIHKSSEHNYINESSTYRGHQDGTGYIRDRGLRSQAMSAAVERAPEWVPDIAAPDCMRCGSHFTAFRRRHHCRNCGKVFCASCSANSIPLPRFGQPKPVRVCEECFQALAKEACGARQVTENSGRQASYAHR